jgi:hypothetical protein
VPTKRVEAFRAFLRAKISIWHLKDPEVKDAARWVSRADLHLQTAERLVLDGHSLLEPSS